MRRRSFLRAAGVAGLGAATGLWASRSEGWGGIPQGAWANPPAPAKILEIFLHGGLSPWESFYCMQPNGFGSFLWQDLLAAYRALTWQANGCGNQPIQLTQTQLFGNDAKGRPVYFGGVTSPLWGLLNQMRVIVMRHDVPAHQGAIPYALTGRKLGRPTLAGLGAAIEHKYLDAKLQDGIPRSYLIMPPSLTASHNFAAALATGAHPASCRPLLLYVPSGDLGTLLGRQTSSYNGQYDPLLKEYLEQYRDELRWSRNNQAGIARSAGFSDYDAVLAELFNAPTIKTIVDGLPLGAPTPVPMCWTNGAFVDPVSAALQAAGQLFAPGPGKDTRYVGIVDNGGLWYNGVGYDTHADHPRTTTNNLWLTLKALADGVAHGDIDLSTTLVVINTEFGRTTEMGSRSNIGRDHFPDGYVTVLLGYPVSQQAVVGSLDPVTGMADTTTAVSPTDLHAALLLAAGIFPFAPDNFAAGDINPHFGGDNTTLVAGLRHTILGLP